MTMYGAVGHSSRKRNLIYWYGYWRFPGITGIIEAGYRNSGFALPVSADRILPRPRADRGLWHHCRRRSPLPRDCVHPAAVYARYLRYLEVDLGRSEERRVGKECISRCVVAY